MSTALVGGQNCRLSEVMLCVLHHGLALHFGGQLFARKQYSLLAGDGTTALHTQSARMMTFWGCQAWRMAFEFVIDTLLSIQSYIHTDSKKKSKQLWAFETCSTLSTHLWMVGTDGRSDVDNRGVWYRPFQTMLSFNPVGSCSIKTNQSVTAYFFFIHNRQHHYQLHKINEVAH